MVRMVHIAHQISYLSHFAQYINTVVKQTGTKIGKDTTEECRIQGLQSDNLEIELSKTYLLLYCTSSAIADHWWRLVSPAPSYHPPWWGCPLAHCWRGWRAGAFLCGLTRPQPQMVMLRSWTEQNLGKAYVNKRNKDQIKSSKSSTFLTPYKYHIAWYNKNTLILNTIHACVLIDQKINMKC